LVRSVACPYYRLLHNGLLFASKDDTLPVLTMVRLEFGTGQVISVGTDRFVLGVTRADYTGEPMVVQLGRADAENLVRIAKIAGQHLVPSVQIGRTERVVTFAFLSTGETITLNDQSDLYEFPIWRSVFPSEPREDAARFVGVDPAKLATFAKVLDARNTRMIITLTGPEHPVLIKIGASFAGMLMPARVVGESSFEQPDWFDSVEEK
jgi:hypothetical protein